jgi:putative FmdB family regulatory protein
MPLYEYRCRDCGHRFEILQRLGEGAAGLICPHCTADALDKQFSTFAPLAAAGANPGNIGDAGGDFSCGAGTCCGGGACGMDGMAGMDSFD